MAYLDYSPVTLPGNADSLRRVGDALSEALRRREQRRQFEQTQVLQREQEERRLRQQDLQNQYQNRIIDSREEREKREFGWRENEMQRRAAADARKASGPQEAEAIAVGAGGTFTPGELPDVGPAPKAPQMPGMPPEIAARMRGKRGGVMPSPEEGALVGPIPSPEEAMNAEVQRIATEPGGDVPDMDARMAAVDEERAAEEAKRKRYETQFESYREENPAPEIGPTAADAAYDQELDAFEAQQKAFPGEQRAYEQKQRDAEGRRPYTIQFPGAAGTTFDFQTQRTAKNQAAASDFLAAVGNMQLSPEDRQAAQIGHQMILGGQDPNKVFQQFQAERTLDAKQRFAGEQGDLNREGRENVARINASRPRASLQIGSGNLDMRQFEQFQKDAERIAKRFGANVDIAGMKQLDAGLAGINSKNQALEQGVVFQITRSMQGVGPLTQQDVDAIRTNISGKLGSLESVLQRLNDGHLGDQEKAVFYGALAARRKDLQNRMQNARGEVDRHFLRPGSPYRQWAGGDENIESEINTIFPGTTPTVKRDTLGPPPPEIGAARKGKQKVKVTTSGPDADARARDLLDDAMAK